MPLKAPTSLPLRPWRCPSCQKKSFTTTSRAQKVGPEHPRYIEIREPPQQTLPERKPIKGVLPVPRDIFGSIKDKERLKDKDLMEEAIQNAARPPTSPLRVEPKPGSRREWREKMAEARRRNLREGTLGLRDRRLKQDKREAAQRRRVVDDLLERRSRPQRDDERYTAADHGLDLKALFSGELPDPNRAERVAAMTANVNLAEAKKSNTRRDDLHTLYMHARSFIVTPEQLDTALDDAFGTPEKPYIFAADRTYGTEDQALRTDSMWAYGSPMTVQDRLDLANRVKPRTATDTASGYAVINKDRIRRIAEGLTGGKMDQESSSLD